MFELIFSTESWKLGTIFFSKTCLGWIIIILGFPPIAVLYVYKALVLLVCKFLHPDLKPVTGIDSAFSVDILAEQDVAEHEYQRRPLNVVGFYSTFGGDNWTIIDVRQHFNTHLFGNVTPWNWRLKSYIVRFGGHSFWKECTDFKLEKHIKEGRLEDDQVAQDFFNNWIMEPFPLVSPLWEVFVVRSSSTNYVALKIHHVLGDGLTIFEMMNSVFSSKHVNRVQQIFDSPAPKFDVMDVVDIIYQFPACIVDFLVEVTTAYLEDPLKDYPGNKSEQWMSTQLMKMSDVKAISKKQKVMYMTVLLSMYAGAIRRYLENRNDVQSIPEGLLIPIPQPWPGRPKRFIGNHWNSLMLRIPIRNSDPLRRLDELQEKIIKSYTSKLFLLMKFGVHNIMAIMPLRLQKVFRVLTRIRYSFSPVISPDDYAYYDGKAAGQIYGMAGLVNPTFALIGITVSHKDDLMWTISGSKELFKRQEDLDLLTNKYLVQELKALQLASGTEINNDSKSGL